MMLFGFREKKEIRKNIKDAIQTVNKIIYDDELWKGRFYMQLESLKFQRYEDWSGFATQLKIKLVDIETGLLKYFYVDYSSVLLKQRLAGVMNDFIVYDIRPKKKTREESVDYRGCRDVRQRKVY